MNSDFLLSVVLCQLIAVKYSQEDGNPKPRNCNTYPKDKIVKEISDYTYVKLKSNATYNPNVIVDVKWQYCGRECSGDYKAVSARIFQDKYHDLFVYDLSPSKSGFYCCNALLEGNTLPHLYHAIQKYALLVLPKNFHPSLRADPEGKVEPNTEVTLTCQLAPVSWLMDVILPTIEWIVPESLSESISANSSEFKYIAEEKLNDKEFQCLAKYQLTYRSKEFRSNIVYGKVKYVTSSETPKSGGNNHTITELGTDAKPTIKWTSPSQQTNGTTAMQERSAAQKACPSPSKRLFSAALFLTLLMKI